MLISAPKPCPHITSLHTLHQYHLFFLDIYLYISTTISMRYVHEGLASLECRIMKREVPNSAERCYVAMPTSSKKFDLKLMMENSHQKCRIGDLLLLNFSILKYLKL